MLKMKKKSKGLFEGELIKDKPKSKQDLPINERLKIARNRKGYSLNMTIKELNRKGVSCALSTLQGYEAADTSTNSRNPSLIMIYHLAELYNCSLDYLFGRTSDMEMPSYDIKYLLDTKPVLYWGSKKIDEEHKRMLIYKSNQIMEI